MSNQRRGDSGKHRGGRRPKSSTGRSRQASSRSRGRTSSKRGNSGGAQPHVPKSQPKRRDLKGSAVDLPRFVIEALERVTPKQRIGPALAALGDAAAAFADGRYHPAVRYGIMAKDLSPRDATIRELLGLASYRVGDWTAALRELRTYRRLSGETTHMPVEMDCLRALGKRDDIAVVWEQLQKLGGRGAVIKEGKVVYASHLIETGDLPGAARTVGRIKLIDNPFPADLRLWYVGARIAALTGEPEDARRIANAILQADPAFPGFDELEKVIGSADGK